MISPISPFTVFDTTTGVILRTGICPAAIVSIQAVAEHEAAIAEHTDPERHYIDLATGEPRDRLPLPYTLETAPGEIRLSGLPSPTIVTVRVLHQVIEVTDGELVLRVDLPGTYQLALSAGVPYCDVELAVDVS